MSDQLTALYKSSKRSLSVLNVKVSEPAREIIGVPLCALYLADSPCRKQTFILFLLVLATFYPQDCQSTVKGRVGPILISPHPSPKCSYFWGGICLTVHQMYVAA